MLYFCYLVVAWRYYEIADEWLAGGRVAKDHGSESRETPPARRNHATMATVAAHLGLSRATVAHVLNGRAEAQRIPYETQNRVREAARELGYRPNPSARAVRAGRFGNIALVQSLRHRYLPEELLYGVTTAIASKKLHLVMTQVTDSVINEETYLPQTMEALSADGVLVNRHAGFPQSFLDRIHELRVPAVFLNVRQEFDCVYPDEVMGGRLATEALLHLGHEHIAYIETEAATISHFSRNDRRTGYEQAMAAAGRTPDVRRIPQEWRPAGRSGAGIPCGVDARVEAARSLLANADRPTGVVAYEIAEAMALVHAAHHLGLRIPEDLSIVVFHHWIDDRFFLPFHTVCNVMAEVGMDAVNMLMEKIENPQIVFPARSVPVRMLEGATCLCPRGRSQSSF